MNLIPQVIMTVLVTFGVTGALIYDNGAHPISAAGMVGCVIWLWVLIWLRVR